MKSKFYLLLSLMTPLFKTKSFQLNINQLSALGLLVYSALTTSFLPFESSYAYSAFKKGDYVVAQIKQNSKFQGSLSQFLYKLAQRETGQQNPPTNIENQLGFIGKYQFGEALLIDLGYYQSNVYYPKNANRNNWQGRWTGKNGINSKQDFLNNKNNVQDSAIQEAFGLNWNRVNAQLKQNGHSINEYLGRTRGGVVITSSGILAAAHLRGETGVARLLLSGEVSQDENGTSILTYLREFAGFKTPFN